MNAIETRGLTKRYGTRDVVDHLDLNIAEGSVCGLLGKNGAGKTTTIKMLVGLTKPSAGTISLMGKVRSYERRDGSRIGYLPDVPNFYGYMTAREYLRFCGRLYRIGRGELESRISELLKQVGLEDGTGRIAGYSRGMKQRLGVAQALINRPEIVFMDEPISALDPIGRREVMALIRSLRGTATVLFSTHILADVENTCDSVVMLEKGRVLESDTIVNIKQRYAANTARLCLYTASDRDKLLAVLKQRGGLSAEMRGPAELLLRGDSVRDLGGRIPVLLAEAGVPLERFEAFAPSLEDVFLEVTAHE